MNRQKIAPKKALASVTNLLQHHQKLMREYGIESIPLKEEIEHLKEIQSLIGCLAKHEK